MSDQPFRLDAKTARQIAALPDPPDADLLVGPFVVRGTRTVIVGDTGHGKTALAAQLVRAVLSGDEALGYQGAGVGPALIVDLEQGLRSIKRVLRETRLEDRDDLIYVAQPDGLALDKKGDHLDELERVIAEHRPVVVCLDPYYKAMRGDANEAPIVADLMRALDELRARYGFALLLPAHPRKDLTSARVRKLTLHDVAGSGVVVRGAELVIAIERVSNGYARLRILKDRDADLPVGEAWGLLFDREQGFRRDPADLAPPRDLLAEIETWIREHPRSTTNQIAEGVKAGKSRVSNLLKTSELFTFEPGPNRSRIWVTRAAENHSGHLFHAGAVSGVPSGDPSLEGHAQVTHRPGDPVPPEPLVELLRETDPGRHDRFSLLGDDDHKEAVLDALAADRITRREAEAAITLGTFVARSRTA